MKTLKTAFKITITAVALWGLFYMGACFVTHDCMVKDWVFARGLFLACLFMAAIGVSQYEKNNKMEGIK